MKGGVYFDPEVPLVQECWAVVTAMQPGKRQRFAESCVQVVASAEAAVALADPAAGRRAARLAGPSRSSEGVRLYYLVRWIE
jgi:hypothetical protein